MLRQRILSALVLGPLALAATWIGSWAFAALILAGAALALREWLRLVGRSPWWIAAGLLYIGLPVVALLWLRGQDRATALWLFLVVWATDSAAYLAGRAVGGWRLLPRISPNKTWAGLVGGLLAAAAVGWAVGAGLGLALGPVALAALSLLLALVAQAGDLLESAVKRRFGAKDTGRLIPGHGGMLDRVDGLLTAAPVAAAMCLAGGGGFAQWR